MAQHMALCDASMLYIPSPSENLYYSTETWTELRSVLRNYVHKNKSVESSTENIVTTEPNVLPETNQAEIKRRRYTAYMSDLGKNSNTICKE